MTIRTLAFAMAATFPVLIAGCNPSSNAAPKPHQTDKPRELKQIWQATGFSAPEGAARDDQYLYISNVVGEGAGKDGEGWISRLSHSGEVLDLKWVDGLNAPKGMAIHDGHLYVADIDVVRVVELATGTVTATLTIENGKFLNDVTVWKNAVFVADSARQTILRIENNETSVFLTDPALGGVNGLLGNGDHLLSSTMTSGSLLKISAEGAITEIATGIPNADGIGLVEGGYLVSSWPGQVFFVSNSGEVSEILNTKEAGILQNDLTVFDQSLVIVPNWTPGTVTAWSYE